MDTTYLLLVLAATLLVSTLYAWRQGNARRDVALLGSFGLLFGSGALAAAIL